MTMDNLFLFLTILLQAVVGEDDGAEVRVHGQKAHWHSKNIVLRGGQWVYVGDEAFGHPNEPFDERWKSPESTVIVLIAALRETRLPDTLKSGFENAKYPERVRFGVVQQNADTDEDVLEAYCQRQGRNVVKSVDADGNVVFSNPNDCKEFDRIRVLRINAKDAAGPVFARGHQPQLVEDEDFCMQIDAHTIFKKDWDVLLLDEWRRAQNEFAVLSTYPTNYKDLDKNSNGHWEMPHICGVALSKSGAISNKQASAAANLDRPLLAPLWAAGLSFSRCHAVRDVPNDINLRHIFSGEEFSRGASITRPIIGVYYGNEKGGKGGWRSNYDEQAKSLERIKTLLEFPNSDQSKEAKANLGKFGLGKKRTLGQYIRFSGVNTKVAKAIDRCLVTYVPWDAKGEKERISRVDEALKAKFAVKRERKRLARPITVRESDTLTKKLLRSELLDAESADSSVILLVSGFLVLAILVCRFFNCQKVLFGKGKKG